MRAPCQPRALVTHGTARVALVAALIGLVALEGPSLHSAWGQLPAIRLSALFPPGAQVGRTVEVTVASGADLEGADRLVFSHPGISAVQKTAAVEGQDEPQPVANQFVVTVAPDVPVGVHEVRVAGTYGLSNPRAFSVGAQPETIEAEPNNAAEQATPLEVGTLVNGRADAARDVDFFRFTAESGQRLLIECWAQRIDSRLDAALSLYDSSGKLLATRRDAPRRDALIDFTAPVGGEYIVKVHDFEFAGGADYFYRLAVSSGPRIDYVFPPAGQPGTTGRFTLYGRNLPEGTATDQVGADGAPLEALEVEIAIPPLDADTPAAAGELVLSSEAGIDAFTYRLPSDEGPTGAVAIGLASAPVVVESEPNDTPADAQVLALPCEVAGRFERAGDIDWFEFEAHQGEVYWIDVISARLGLPTDPLLVVQQVTVDGEGREQIKELAAQDDPGVLLGGQVFNTLTADPALSVSIPADGRYRVMVRDQGYAGLANSSWLYRLAIRPAAPDFRLVVLAEYPIDPQASPNPWSTLVRKGGTESLAVFAFRRDGFGGEIHLEVEDLPAGVTCRGATIGPGKNRAMLVLSAAEDAEDWLGPIRVVGRAAIGEGEVVREARPAAITWPALNRAEFVRLAQTLSIAVGQTAPFSVDTLIERVVISQSHLLEVPLAVVRRDALAADLTLAPVELPGEVKVQPLVLKADTADPRYHLYFPPNAPTGTYTFHLLATANVPFTKNADGSDKKDVAVASPSTPITVEVVPAPLTLSGAFPDGNAIKPGGQRKVAVSIKRAEGVAGPVTLHLWLPQSVQGITAAPVELAADQNEAELIIEAADDATQGEVPVAALRAHVEHGGRMLEVDAPITLKIEP